jgi:hypothetical protein
MKQKDLLTIASLISLLFLFFHLTDDLNRGVSPVGPWTLITLPIAAVMLWGTLVLTERRAGYIITLLIGIAAVGMPVLHLGIGTVNVTKPGTFFFIFTLFALGVIGIFTMILSVRGLVDPHWGEGK